MKILTELIKRNGNPSIPVWQIIEYVRPEALVQAVQVIGYKTFGLPHPFGVTLPTGASQATGCSK